MILQALNDYYGRLAEDEDADVAPPGFSQEKISFALVLDRAGTLVDVHDLREQKGKKLLPRVLRVPQAVTRSGKGMKANFLWDNTGYVLGADAKGKPERAAESFRAFKELAAELGKGLGDKGVEAVLAFLESWEPGRAIGLEQWEDMAGQNVVFRLDGERGFVHDSPGAQRAWVNYWSRDDEAAKGQCLVTGESGPLARLHPPLKTAQSSWARLVSFNLDAFTSYGKEQNYNAPVSASAAFNYTTALNRLLAQGSRQKIQIGDATVVFWSKDESEMEELLGMTLSGGQAEDEALNQRLAEFLKAVKLGVPYPHLDPDNPFFILGLSPNASRLSVRFWHQSTVGQLQERLGEHLRDLEIVRYSEKLPEHPPVWMLLRETAAQGKDDNIPPLLAGEMARAILTGQAYPRILLTALVGRLRADKEVGYLRAALVKAYLSRLHRLSQTYRNDPRSMEVTVSLDTQSTNPAYRLGRLFAVLEDLQRSALGQKINSTIRDKYLSSASSAPRATFPMLLRLAQAHIKKSEWGGKYDRHIQQILNEVTEWPASLSLEEQGLFFLGYYHQKAHRPVKDANDQEPAAAAAEESED